MDFTPLINHWNGISVEQRSILLFGGLISLVTLFIGFIFRELIWKAIIWVFRKLFHPKKQSAEPMSTTEEAIFASEAVGLSEIGTHIIGSRVNGGVQPVSIQIVGANSGPINISQPLNPDPRATLPPTNPETSLATPEDALSIPPRRNITVELEEKSLSICGDIERYFPGNGDSIRTEYIAAQRAKTDGKMAMAAGKYTKIFNNILRLLGSSPHCSTQELKDLLFELGGNIQVMDESLKMGHLEQSELDSCELHIMRIFTKFPV